MKYIIIERELDNEMKHVVPIVFPNMLVHKDVAEATLALLRKQFGSGGSPGLCKVVSAGTFYINGGNVRCVDGSKTLKLESRPEDASIIAHIDYYQITEK